MIRALNPFAPHRLWQRTDADAAKLYGAIVAQARLPLFYQALGVPDTLQGRFSVLALNLFAVLRRLRGEGGKARDMSQALIDRFSADMETVLRELGIGDLSIPKKVRGLAASSAALLAGYDEAYDDGGDALAGAVAESLPLEGAAAEAAGRRLAHYVQEVVRHLEAQPLAALRAGAMTYPEVTAVTGRELKDCNHEPEC